MDEASPEKSRLCSSSSSAAADDKDLELEQKPLKYWQYWTLGGRLRIRNKTVRECLAETFGTFLLTVFAIGGVMQAVLSEGQAGNPATVALSVGVGVFIGIQSSISISGGHINPVVSLLFAMRGELPWWKVPLYSLAQHIGAFLGAALIYAIYRDAILALEEGSTGGLATTAFLWASYPRGFVSIPTGIITHVSGTAMLILCLATLTDHHNLPTPMVAAPAMVGAVVMGLASCMSLNAGGVGNPAVDLSARLFSTAAGWGTETLSYDSWRWLWVPVLSPYLGTVLAVVAYTLFIGMHVPTAVPRDKRKKVKHNAI